MCPNLVMSSQKIEGLEALDAQLAAIARQIAEQGAPAAAHAAARVLYQEVERTAPEDSGELKSALEIVQAQEPARSIAAVSVADSQKGGALWHAVLLEYGTSHMPPHPFMRPAFETAQRDAHAAAAAALQQTLIRTTS